MNRIDFISFEEFLKLSKAEKRKEVKLAIILAYGSGLRISEILGLRKSISRCCKVAVEQRKIVREDGRKIKRFFCPQCQKQLTSKDQMRSKDEWLIPPLTPDKIDLEKHQIRLDVAKGGKWRITVASPALTPELVKLLPLTMPRITLQYRIKALCKKVLGKNMSFHILRHGFGNYQANLAKLPLPIVQQLMGHANVNTTSIYVKANPEHAISEAWKGMSNK